MIKKKAQSEALNKAILIMSKEEFSRKILDRIEEGKKLLAKEVPFQKSPQESYYGYSVRRAMLPVEPSEVQQNFIAEFRKWTDYNSELLKQAFDIPNNEYQSHYVVCGQVMVMSANEDLIKIYKDELREKIDYLDSLNSKIDLLPCSSVNSQITSGKKTVLKDSKKVFIVHGHDDNLRSKVELFVRELGFEPIVLFKQPNMGETIIQKLQREANDVVYSIILYTPCDLGKDKDKIDEEMKPRARQNVVFEHGYMCALLGMKNVCALVDDKVEISGDLSGVLFVPVDNDEMWKFRIAKEMKAVGLKIDTSCLI